MGKGMNQLVLQERGNYCQDLATTKCKLIQAVKFSEGIVCV